MGIQFNCTNQISHWFNRAKPGNTEDCVFEAPKRTRLSGLYDGPRYVLLSVGARVGSVAECVFKGLGNILSAPLSRNCKSKGLKGFEQLGYHLPKNIFMLAFIMPLEVVKGFFVIPISRLVGKERIKSDSEFETILDSEFETILDSEFETISLDRKDDEYFIVDEKGDDIGWPSLID